MIITEANYYQVSVHENVQNYDWERNQCFSVRIISDLRSIFEKGECYCIMFVTLNDQVIFFYQGFRCITLTGLCNLDTLESHF